ncbi:hypothetical protein B0H13DRAFT_2026403 [Mycena leptocephala]|nr:hypothetical protein B0H13DRAFT_2026403 [Mycena leptocephala]
MTSAQPPLKTRIWATVTCSTYRVKRWKKMSAAAKKDVEEMVTYIGTTEYKSFSQDYDMHVSSWFRAYVVLTAPSLAHAFENYDRYLEAGKWQMASTMKSTIVEYSSRIVSNSVVGVCYLSSGLSLKEHPQSRWKMRCLFCNGVSGHIIPFFRSPAGGRPPHP